MTIDVNDVHSVMLAFFLDRKIEKSEMISWFNSQLENTSKVIPEVSHVARLTHSSSKAISILDSVNSDNYPYLITTKNVNSEYLDASYKDAKFQTLSKFLTLSVKNSNKKLGTLLAENPDFFSLITNDEKLRKVWSDQVKIAYQHIPISHTLAKQVYIYIGDGNYHLVSPMLSSTLAHEIFKEIEKRNDLNKLIEQARDKNEWSEVPYIRYPNTARLRVTGGNKIVDIIKAASNVSILNIDRRGSLLLFSALPPKWETNSNPPTSIKQLLQLGYSGRLFSQVEYLIKVFKENKLFINHERKLLLKELIEDIVYKIFDEIMLIRHSQPSGWTENLSMPMYLRLLLDPKILHTQQFSQPEITAFFDEFKLEIAKWISLGINDEIRTKSLESLWLKIISPMMQEFYQTLKAE